VIVAPVGLGLPIGGVIGALGGGGAVLTVPALVYLLVQNAHDATAAALVVVGIASAAAALSHIRARTVRWDVVAPFAAVGAIGSVLGTALSKHLSEAVLMSGFAVLMLVAATAMLKAPGRIERTPWLPAAAPARHRLGVPAIGAGFAVGLLTGVFGVGGGFLSVPALTLGLGLPMSTAIGTAMVVASVNAAAGFAARAGTVHLELSVVGPFTIATVVAAVIAQRLARRLPDRTLVRAFAALLTLTAALVAGKALG
jgi:uncharacterized membrane protein YfcA